MFELSLTALAIVALCALLVGMAKTGVSGLGIVVVPLIADVFPAKISTGVLLPLLIAADIIAVWYYRRHAQWKYLWGLIPSAVVGIVIGYFLMGVVGDRQLKLVIGVVILLLIGLTVLRDKGIIPEDKIPTGTGFVIVVGMAAGITTMLANAAGPIMVVYLLAMRLPKNEFIGTGSWYFLLLNCFKVPFSVDLGLISPESLLLNLKVLPFILIGGALGIWLIKRMNDKSYVRWVQILASLSAIKLLLS